MNEIIFEHDFEHGLMANDKLVIQKNGLVKILHFDGAETLCGTIDQSFFTTPKLTQRRTRPRGRGKR